jgi:hypothetical protein
LSDTARIATVVSGSPGAGDKEFRGTATILAFFTEVNGGRGVTVVSKVNHWHRGDRVVATNANESVAQVGNGGFSVLNSNRLHTLSECVAGAGRLAENIQNAE